MVLLLLFSFSFLSFWFSWAWWMKYSIGESRIQGYLMALYRAHWNYFSSSSWLKDTVDVKGTSKMDRNMYRDRVKGLENQKHNHNICSMNTWAIKASKLPVHLNSECLLWNVKKARVKCKNEEGDIWEQRLKFTGQAVLHLYCLSHSRHLTAGTEKQQKKKHLKLHRHQIPLGPWVSDTSVKTLLTDLRGLLGPYALTLGQDSATSTRSNYIHGLLIWPNKWLK